jgi:hypothetical protein
LGARRSQLQTNANGTGVAPQPPGYSSNRASKPATRYLTGQIGAKVREFKTGWGAKKLTDHFMGLFWVGLFEDFEPLALVNHQDICYQFWSN